MTIATAQSDAQAAKRPPQCGVRLLHDGKDAFAARVLLLRAARHTLDIQYYIWHDDLSGSLLLEEIASAAARGVQVRLLLDDNGISGLDGRLSALAEHENIAVRLFNPFPLRRLKPLSWLFAFRRLNSRMHAKSITADGKATIVGGRNVGDEYFDAKAQGLFEDLDLLAAGLIAGDVRAQFERHWLSPDAKVLAEIVPRVSRAAKAKALARSTQKAQSDAAERYRAAIRDLPFVEDLRDGDLDLVAAPLRLSVNRALDSRGVADAPCGLDELMPEGLARPQRELILISGYFVPTPQGTADLVALARRGVDLRVLTNSFAATDVGLVHAGYAPARRPLLESGVSLFEMPAPDDEPKTARKFIRPGSAGTRARSGRSLHAKVYLVDRRYIYIGSANFDPRSVWLNSELGIVIDSPDIAERMCEAFQDAARNSYQLAVDGAGRLCWTDQRDDDPEPEFTEPATTRFSRSLVALLSRLPIARHL